MFADYSECFAKTKPHENSLLCLEKNDLFREAECSRTKWNGTNNSEVVISHYYNRQPCALLLIYQLLFINYEFENNCLNSFSNQEKNNALKDDNTKMHTHIYYSID